jgi:hypothetical protein
VKRSEIPKVTRIFSSFSASKKTKNKIYGIDMQVAKSNLALEVEFLCVSRWL